MSQKKLNENAIINELKGSSLFFPKEGHSPAAEDQPKDPATVPVVTPEGAKSGKVASTMTDVRKGDIVKAPEEPTKEKDSDHASTLASYPDSLINSIRKTVKSPGKEVSFTRLTPEEKNRLMDIVYTYKRQGVRTSENEINRIAVNFMLEDFRANGRASMLARVIEALLA